MNGTVSTPAASPSGRPVSRAEQAAALGVSLRHLYRLLADERWREGQRRGRDELPYVELAEGERPARYHYRLDADHHSRLPDCPFRIGVGSTGLLQVAHRDDIKGERPAKKKPPPKFRPKRPSKKKDRSA